MARESSFWNWLRDHTRSLGRFTRIESEISPGVPDVYFALDTIAACSGWIELKSLKAPKRASAKPLKRRGLNSDQVEWISHHHKLGVNVQIFVKLGSVVYCFMGDHAQHLNNYTFEEIQEVADRRIPLRRDKSWTLSELTEQLLRRLPPYRAKPSSSPLKASTRASVRVGATRIGSLRKTSPRSRTAT